MSCLAAHTSALWFPPSEPGGLECPHPRNQSLGGWLTALLSHACRGDKVGPGGSGLGGHRADLRGVSLGQWLDLYLLARSLGEGRGWTGLAVQMPTGLLPLGTPGWDSALDDCAGLSRTDWTRAGPGSLHPRLAGHGGLWGLRLLPLAGPRTADPWGFWEPLQSPVSGTGEGELHRAGY